MKKRSLQGRITAFILTLCVAATLMPISAFSDGVNYISKINVSYEHIDYKAGDTPRTTATVSNADAHCTVAYEYWREIYQKEEGGVWSGTGRYWYSDPDKMASLSPDKRITTFEAGKHYSYNIVLATDSGYFISGDETVVSVGGYEWGTPDHHTNLAIKELSTKLLIYSPYSVDIPDDSNEEQTITSAAIEDVRFNYGAGDIPKASALVTPVDYEKYEVVYECWQQFENNEPVAAWYSDNGSHGSLPTFKEFEGGKKYVYSLMLKPKDGYSFSSDTVITVNGQKVLAPFVGGSMYIPAIKTITTSTVTFIDVVEINDATISFKDGDKPVFTGTTSDNRYRIVFEAWRTDGEGISSEEWFNNEDHLSYWGGKLISTFDKNKTYYYEICIITSAQGSESGCYFSPNTKLIINGEEVSLDRISTDNKQQFSGITKLAMKPIGSDTSSDNSDTSSDNNDTSSNNSNTSSDSSDTSSNNSSTSSSSNDTSSNNSNTSSDSSDTSANNSTNTNSKAPVKNNAGSINPNTGNNVGGIAFAILITGGGLVVAGRRSRKNR